MVMDSFDDAVEFVQGSVCIPDNYAVTLGNVLGSGLRILELDRVVAALFPGVLAMS